MLSPSGKFLPPSWYQKLIGTTPKDVIRQRLSREIKAAQRIEKELLRIKSRRLQQLKLLEYSRLDYLSPLERRIYMKTRMRWVSWSMVS